jgi:SAM-dependent methyltransferase
LEQVFDIVYSIGVLQHTLDPDKSFENIKRFVKPGGKLIIWVYSFEGNFLNRALLEPLKNLFFLKISKGLLEILGKTITAIMYIPIYSIYLTPLGRILPYDDYFKNWRKLSFARNFLNVFDKLNAPTTNFIKESQVVEWFSDKEFKDIHIDHYKKVSWRASATKI